MALQQYGDEYGGLDEFHDDEDVSVGPHGGPDPNAGGGGKSGGGGSDGPDASTWSQVTHSGNHPGGTGSGGGSGGGGSSSSSVSGSSSGGSSIAPGLTGNPRLDRLIGEGEGLYYQLWGEFAAPGYVKSLVNRGMNIFEIEDHERRKPAFKRTDTYQDEWGAYAKAVANIMGTR